MYNAYASVESGFDKGINYEMQYPLVYTENKSAQNKINQDIYRYIAKFKTDYNNGEFFKGWFKYDVKYEDDKLLSLTIYDGRYRGGAHEHYCVYGLVYDKRTGKRLPISNFVRLTLNSLQAYSSRHLYNEDGTKAQYERKPERVSEDYYLLGNGGLALIYEPGELGSFGQGAITIRLNDEDIDYFNRLNK